MNSVGYDVGIPGNHEFDFGFPVLLERASSLNYPLICANLSHPDGSSVFPEYVVLEKKGVKVGFFGLLTPDAAISVKTSKMGDTVVTDPVEASYSHLGTASGGFLQIPGMAVTYDPSAGIGSRVVSIRMDGSEVNPDGLYTVCTTDYPAKGGDGNTALTGYAYAGVGDNAMALSMYLLRLEIIKESDIQMGRQTAVEVFDAQNSLMEVVEA